MVSYHGHFCEYKRPLYLPSHDHKVFVFEMVSQSVVKFGLIISVIFASVASQCHLRNVEMIPQHDGQPGCQIRYEFTRRWRNNYDNSLYWECRLWSVPAEQRSCPPGTLFQDSWQTCLPAGMWEWTPYSEPPTRAGQNNEDQCEPLDTGTCPPPTTPTYPPPTTTPGFPTGKL